MSNFDTAIQRLLLNEGGYVWDENDPGGETNWGICKRDHPDLDIKNLTREQAKYIYRSRFWDVVHGDELPLLAAFQLLDFAVNAGTGTAIRKAQWAAGVADDGFWGPVTRAAILGLHGSTFVMRFTAAKIRYYTRLTTFGRFGPGWMARCATDLELAASDEAAS
jgi:lysozyme family protein